MRSFKALAPPMTQKVTASDKRDGASSASDSDDGDASDPDDNGHVEDSPLQWHGDHWDELPDYESPYLSTWPGEDWLNTHFDRAECSVSNEHLLGNNTTQHWLQKLAHLRPQDFPTLKFAPLHFVSVKIPLFNDEETGDEYQIALHLSDKLVFIECPREPTPYNEQARPLVKIRYQVSPSTETTEQTPALPRFVIPLGTLLVRTKTRHPPIDNIPETEYTDYQVVLDPENDAMPLWLFCSRRMLKERHESYQGRIPQLPIFKSLMEYEEHGYDAACVLDSIHRLGDIPSFQEACEMVQRTRTIVDPVSMNATLEKMEELIGGPVSTSVT